MSITINGDGIISGVSTFSNNTATFSGNVGVAGTLTYEDVTNIDSVGLITARSGVVLTGGDVTLGTGVTISGETSNVFTVNTNGSERVRVSSAGSFGIGTDNPSCKLHLLSSGGAATGSEGIRLETTQATGGNWISFNDTARKGYFGYKETSDDGIYLVNEENSHIVLGTNGSEKVRIGSSGQLGIGGANYGTSGQVLTSQGSGSAPQWADAGGGAWNFISSVTASNSASVAFTSGIDSTYDIYVITGTRIIPTSDDQLVVRLSNDGGSTWRSTAGDYGSSSFGGATVGEIIPNSIESTSSGGAHFALYLYSPSSSNAKHFAAIYSVHERNTAAFEIRSTLLAYQGTTTYNAIQFFIFSGGNNISTGTFRLYGISNS